jgi:hypothetical protein
MRSTVSCRSVSPLMDFDRRGPVASVAPEVLEPRRRQLGVSHGVLDRSMAEPILDCPGVVAGVRQRVSAAVPQHVGMDQEVEAGALPNALDQAVDRIGRKWSVLLGLKHEARVGKFPPQLFVNPPANFIALFLPLCFAR